MEHMLSTPAEAQKGQDGQGVRGVTILAESDRMKDAKESKREHIFKVQDKVAKIEKFLEAAQKNISGWIIPPRRELRNKSDMKLIYEMSSRGKRTREGCPRKTCTKP